MSPPGRIFYYLLCPCLLTVTLNVSAQRKKDLSATEKFKRFDTHLSAARELYLEQKYDKAFLELKAAEQDGVQSGTKWFYMGMTNYYLKDKRSAMRYLAKGVIDFQSEPCKEAYALLKDSDAPAGTLTIDLAPAVIPYTVDTAQYKQRPSQKLKNEYGARSRHTVTKSYNKEPGTWNAVIAIPLLYSFSLKPTGEPRKENQGSFGITLGAEYFYERTHFFSFMATGATDLFFIPGASYDDDGETESLSTLSLSVMHNTKINRVNVGYGIAYSNNLWSRSGGYNDKKKSDHTLGFAFDGDYQVLPHLHVGLTYQPSLLRLNPGTEFIYQHLFAFTIRAKFGRMVK